MSLISCASSAILSVGLEETIGLLQKHPKGFLAVKRCQGRHRRQAVSET